MDDGIVLEIYCELTEEVEAADTAPGSINVNRTSPTNRLIVRDLAKYFDDFIVHKLSPANYKFTNLCRFDDRTLWLYE
jgi:hypothetical protein